MHKKTKRFLIIFSAAVVTVFIGLNIVLSSVLSHYDAETRKSVLAMISHQLPKGASAVDMENFMRKHTTRFGNDEQFEHQYAGIMAQTKFDTYLFDRKVQIVLDYDKNHTFIKAKVRIIYTFL